MGIFRRANNQNIIVGLILLIALAFLAGPDALSRFLTPISPYFEGVPCDRLRRADDRANHQSLLGRAAANPIQLRIAASSIPTDPNGSLFITITVINNSVGSVPIVYNPNEVIAGDNGTSGLGIIFSPQTSTAGVGLGSRAQQPAAIPEEDIRLLGPRQRCIHQIDIAAGNVLTNAALANGQASVIAYYRGTTRGSVPAANPTPIYTDQGLPTGVSTSAPVQLRIPGQ
ncbi:MAG: hypothetical protein SF162_02525 [bacterium]|nr:hypothetical protein [bacterium]